MGFWGIEVKPGKPHPYHSDNVKGRLCVTQATLGLGSSKERCILQCSVGHKNQIFLCSLLPDRIESCSLNLEFKDELVAFSVIGTRSIHLSGYFVSDDEGDYLRDEYESDSGEDIADTETDESSEYDYDDEFDDHFVVDDDDDDLEMFPPSPVPKSGVVIEEITDNNKPANRDGQFNEQNRDNQSHDNVGHGQQQMVVSSGTGLSVLESEDEDGFPISLSQKSEVRDQEQEDELNEKRTTKETKKKKARDYDGDASAKKRKVTSTGPDDQPESRLKKKEKKKQKEKGKDIKTDEIDDDQANEIAKDEIQPEVMKLDSSDRKNHDTRGMDADGVCGESSSDKKRKKRKNKKIQDPGEGENKDGTATIVGNETQSLLEPVKKESAAKSSHIRTFANGLVIEELAMGKPDGKRASPGNRVGVCYIGKLQKNGKIFDSNVGRKPFEFRLGVGQVIKGWDVGVNGMRVGDKRRLIIPPSMGYGDKPVGGKIPPNSWLVFDVELVNVR